MNHVYHMLRYPFSVSVSVMYFARYALAYRTLTTQVLRVTSQVLYAKVMIYDDAAPVYV